MGYCELSGAGDTRTRCESRRSFTSPEKSEFGTATLLTSSVAQADGSWCGPGSCYVTMTVACHDCWGGRQAGWACRHAVSSVAVSSVLPVRPRRRWPARAALWIATLCVDQCHGCSGCGGDVPGEHSAGGEDNGDRLVEMQATVVPLSAVVRVSGPGGWAVGCWVLWWWPPRWLGVVLLSLRWPIRCPLSTGSARRRRRSGR